MSRLLDFNSALTITQLEAEQRSRAHVDLEDIKSRITASARSFVEWLFSGRAFLTKSEARIGDVNGAPGASLSIALTGQDAGLWHDHATGEGGDLISLYMAYMGYGQGRNFQLALKEIASEFLGDPVKVDRPFHTVTVRDRIEEKKQKLGTKPRDDLTELGVPTAKYPYYDTRGNVIASVVRYEPDGTRKNKTFRPYCFRLIDGQNKWVKGMPDLRPLFQVPDIVSASQVVLTEGEGKALALGSLGIPATSAMGGCNTPIEKTDWSPLHGKKVIVWPDNDESGRNYGRVAAEHLAAIGCEVLVLQIPVGKSVGWDAADCIAEGGDPHLLIAEAISLVSVARSRIRIVDIDELESLPPPQWLIDGILTQNGLAVIWGRSGDMKSFVAVDVALCVATGSPWHGKAVQRGLVIYIAAEGSYGLAKRAVGWRRTRGKDLPKPKFKLIPHSIALPTDDDLNALVAAISGLDEKPILIIIDTMARTFGAGDENKQADMNAYVNAADRLREATGANVTIVHHSGVSEDKRERGSNVLRGAADTVIKVKRTNDQIDIINKAPEGKQKDAEEFETVKLRTQKVSYTQAEIEHTTLVLNLSEGSPVRGSDEPGTEDTKFGKVETAILKALADAGEPLGLTRLALMTCINKGSLTRSLDTLIEKNRVERTDDGVENRKLWRLI